MSRLDDCIALAPDPQAAARRLESMHDVAPLMRAVHHLPPRPLQEFVAVVSVSAFLFRTLCRHPELVPLTGSPPIVADLDRCEGVAELRRAKYRELYRIACMDLGAQVDYGEVLRALSALADGIVNRAVALDVVGTDDWIWRDALCVMALGKLGARELNFSSDIDLIFVSDGHEPSGHDIGPFQERLLQSARGLSRLLEEKDDAGFLYRVDLNLRPWGRSGPLFMSVDGTEHYYESSSDIWERYAWLRARPLAGAVALGQDLLERLRPFRFLRSLSGGDLERFVDIKSEMGRARVRHGHWNVKVGDGGIRDIEFFIQTLQLLNGARDPGLQSTNTLEALSGLAAAGLVGAEDAQRIRRSYLFLRRLENRLQMIDEQQVHELPDDPERRTVLARSMGVARGEGSDVLERFEGVLEEARTVARNCFESILPDRTPLAAPRDAEVRTALRKAWHVDAAESSLERWHQVCAQEEWGPVPRDLPTLVRVFGSSWYLTRFMFFRGLDAAQLLDTPPATGLSSNELRRWIETVSVDGDAEQRLESLRIARNEILLLLLAAWLNGRLDQEQLEQALSVLAAVVIQAVLGLFGVGSGAGQENLAVLGMGRLAGGEMTFGSDLDLIFLYGTGERREPVELSRRVRRLLRHIAAATPAGMLYDVDMRLRPHGSAGALLTSTESFVQYHAGRRDVWERQMMTRCRPVFDPDGLGQAAVAAIEPHVYAKCEDRVLRGEIASMRLRVERELGRPPGRIELKRGRGGLMDVDFTAHYLQLAQGHADPGLRVCSTRQVLRIARDRQRLPADAAVDLLEGYEYLKRMETCLRLFDLKSISAFAPESEAGHALARAMGCADSGNEGLVEQHRAVSERVRQRFEEVVGGGELAVKA
ncbi:MAG: hypothetical protein HYY48_06805 [Gammaproteobacteria bacterium]|nr:hypothetical protein [Gammaproteobacteria bacterium]